MGNKNLNILQEFNILYLEDDNNLREHTKDVLEDFVNNIYAVATSNEALSIILNHKVDVIISDILLENENGIDFLKYLKEDKNIQIPCILTTAHTDTKYLLNAIQLKVENYIIKPINIKELLNTLHDILLPVIQQKEIQKNHNIIKTISTITDSKQVEVINYIFNNLNNENLLIASYAEIMGKISISKPTLIKLFKELAQKKILVKTQHKTYRFDEKSLHEL
ncbi:MAG: response regulator [Campylobacteraceae bacterium]|nr:response regulator [Campylobacteraceae bacterium]